MMLFQYVKEPGRVLVIDDQQANLDTARMLLEAEGYLVRCEVSGRQGLDAIPEFKPDLILLDMMMPGMDGFDVLRELREQQLTQRIPVLFVTAAYDDMTLERAFDLGVVDFVARPYRRSELRARVNAHLRLKQTNDRLQRTAREREELVNLVAHDLKNPLSSILFATQMLRDGSVAPERIGRYYEIIQDAGNDAVGYIHDYLEQRAAQTQAVPQAGRANLTAVAEWIDRRYRERLEQTGMPLTVIKPPEPVTVSIAEQVLRQVGENLITNALKYAPNAPVEVAVHAGAPGYWRLRVTDHGPGLTESQQRQLFKPFIRLHSQRQGSNDERLSSGLGLSLAKRTIESHGGQMWYERGSDGGSSFVIEARAA